MANQSGNLNINRNVNPNVQPNNNAEEPDVLAVITQKFADIDRNIEQLPATVVKTVKQMGAYEVLPGDRNLDENREKFLQYKNILRSMRGLKIVPYIYCKICKETNMHFTNNCPRLVCFTCLNNGHTSNNCPRKMICQICGELDHPTAACRSDQAVEIRMAMNKVCMLCKCKGHIARVWGKQGSGWSTN